ncbi:putative haloalkane dehalogenase [Arabidopsis thaliana]
MAVHIHNPNFFHTHHLRSSLTSSSASPSSYLFHRHSASKYPSFLCKSNNKDDYLIDAPVSVGDGFSFSGGKYSDQPSPSDEWLKQGKWVKAHRVGGSGVEAKDPIFGLTMGAGSQASKDLFRWFSVESGSVDSPPVILIHGFPSQAYSYRKTLPVLSKNYRAIAFDWLGFGFSDKPQAGYGFNYTMDEFVSSLESFIDEVTTSKVSLVVQVGSITEETRYFRFFSVNFSTLVFCQGYFSAAVVKYARNRPDKIKNLILLNPPLTPEHAKLPSTLSVFSNFLLGEIFSQVSFIKVASLCFPPTINS